MKKFTSILNILDHHAAEQPDRLAFASLQNGATPSATLTFGQLRQSVISAAEHLQTLAARGERVVLLYDHPFEFLVPFLACLYAGLIAVPAPLPNTFTAKRVLARMQGIFKDARPVLALTTGANIESLAEAYRELPDSSSLEWIATDQFPARAENWSPLEVESQDAAYLQYTSGSTSAPKGVVITHGNIMHQLDYLRRVWTAENHITGMVSWMPYYHDMGLFSGILFPLFMTAPCYLMPPVMFIRHPECWLEAVSNFRASHTVGPVFAYDLVTRKLTPDQRATLDLSCLEMACLGAEPIQPGIVEAFIATFRPHGFSPEALIPGYGLAEATLAVSVTPLTGGPLMASFDKADLARRRVTPASGPEATRLVSSGRALPDVPVEIVNENTFQRCAPDEIGEIWLGGESIADGYWEKEEDNQKTFEAYLADSNEGPFLRTGDLGFFHDGVIYIAGRIKDMMIFQGQNFYPQDIEWAVQNCHPELQKGACAAFSVDVEGHEQLVVCQEVTSRHSDQLQYEKIASAIRRAIASQHGLTTHAVVLFRKGSISKTSSGKIQRHAARNDFVNGNFESAVYVSFTESLQGEVTAPRNELEAALVKIFEEVLKVSPLGLDDNFFERGGDSLGFIILSELVEERLGLTLPLERPMENLNARALARVLGGEEEPVVGSSQQRWPRLRSAFKTALQQANVDLLKAFPYRVVDAGLRWFSRQAWARDIFFRQDSQRIRQILSDTGEPAPTSELIAQWVYSNLLYHWRMAVLNDEEEFAQRVRVTGLEHLQQARESGRGAIVLSSNVGWKHLALVSLKGQNVEDMMQVGGGTRTLGLIGLTQLKSQFLLTIDEEMIKSNSHLSYQLARGKQVLEHGGLLFIAGDGQRGQQKKDMPFLNRQRSFGTGFAELALTTDALVVPVLTSLRADGTADVTFHPPLTVPQGSHEEQVRSLVEQYARLLEEYWKTNLPNVRWKQMKQYLSLPLK